ncbi:MAG: hypothetical protein WC492_04925 [Candidatus Micrarchaeia archaeon]
MKFLTLALAAMLLILPSLMAQAQNNTANTTIMLTTGSGQFDSPWSENSKVCIFVREWVLKGMFLIVLLVFLTGVAAISGAAFPEWRNYGSKMIMGSIAAMVLYIIGMQALKFFMGTTICGL